MSVYVHATTIGGKWKQSKATKVGGLELVEEVCYLFRQVVQLAVLAKPYLVCADDLLPPQRSPVNVMFTRSSKMVEDRTSPWSGPSPCPPRSVFHLSARREVSKI